MSDKPVNHRWRGERGSMQPEREESYWPSNLDAFSRGRQPVNCRQILDRLTFVVELPAIVQTAPRTAPSSHALPPRLMNAALQSYTHKLFKR